MVDELARLLEEGCDALVQAERESRDRVVRPARPAADEEETQAQTVRTAGQPETAQRMAAEHGAVSRAGRRAIGKQAEGSADGGGEAPEEAERAHRTQTAEENTARTLPLLLQTRRLEDIRARMEQGALAAQTRLSAQTASLDGARGRTAAFALSEGPGRRGSGDAIDGTALGLWDAMGRRGADERTETAEGLDRLMQRDSRRYDSGFYLY